MLNSRLDVRAGTFAQGSWHSNISFTPGGTAHAPFGIQQGTQLSVAFLCLIAICSGTRRLLCVIEVVIERANLVCLDIRLCADARTARERAPGQGPQSC